MRREELTYIRISSIFKVSLCHSSILKPLSFLHIIFNSSTTFPFHHFYPLQSATFSTNFNGESIKLQPPSIIALYPIRKLLQSIISGSTKIISLIVSQRFFKSQQHCLIFIEQQNQFQPASGSTSNNNDHSKFRDMKRGIQSR